jgi:hypothetical protein
MLLVQLVIVIIPSMGSAMNGPKIITFSDSQGKTF